MRQLKTIALASLAALLCPVVAFAHPGHAGDSFMPGFLHPFTGVDHMLAMLSVGAWAALLAGRARWLVPLSFLLAMAAGGALAISGVQFPFVESGILASVLIMGLVLLFALRMPVACSVAIAALFALFHGHAHGQEMPLDAGGIGYACGFIVATATLLALGELLATLPLLVRQPRWIRAFGGAVVAAGLLLAVGVI